MGVMAAAVPDALGDRAAAFAIGNAVRALSGHAGCQSDSRTRSRASGGAPISVECELAHRQRCTDSHPGQTSGLAALRAGSCARGTMVRSTIARELVEVAPEEERPVWPYLLWSGVGALLGLGCPTWAARANGATRMHTRRPAPSC